MVGFDHELTKAKPVFVLYYDAGRVSLDDVQRVIEEFCVLMEDKAKMFAIPDVFSVHLLSPEEVRRIGLFPMEDMA